MDFNEYARNFFLTSLKVDVGGQFKASKNNFVETITEALKTGDTGTAIKKLEEKLLGKLDKEGRRVNSELVKKLDYVVRDNIYRSRNFSRSLQMEQTGIKRVKIVAILDQRTSNICKALNGKTVEIKTVNTYITDFLADNPERAGFWQDRKNPTEAEATALGLEKMTGDQALQYLGHKAPPYHIRCRTTLVASFDITARSIAEAKAIAKNEFGINADYSKGNLEMANYVNQSFGYMKERGIELPAKATIGVDEIMKRYNNNPIAKSAHAAYDYSVDEILINETSYLIKNPEYMKLLGGKNNKGYSTDNIYHPMIHEIGHRNHYNTNQEQYLSIRNAPLSIEELKVAETISQIATKSKGEFVAEIFVGLTNGEKYSESVMKLYSRFIGE